MGKEKPSSAQQVIDDLITKHGSFLQALDADPIALARVDVLAYYESFGEPKHRASHRELVTFYAEAATMIDEAERAIIPKAKEIIRAMCLYKAAMAADATSDVGNPFVVTSADREARGLAAEVWMGLFDILAPPPIGPGRTFTRTPTDQRAFEDDICAEFDRRLEASNHPKWNGRHASKDSIRRQMAACDDLRYGNHRERATESEIARAVRRRDARIRKDHDLRKN